MEKLTAEQDTLIYIAKHKLNNKGVESFKTKLFETDCKVIETIKNCFLMKYKSKEYKITPEYARQVINIDELKKFKAILEQNKEEFEDVIGKQEFKLLYKNIYYALMMYSLKLDEIETDKNIAKLVELCENKIELKSASYDSTYSINSMLEQEKKFLDLLLSYNLKKIAKNQKENLNNTEINKETEKEN